MIDFDTLDATEFMPDAVLNRHIAGYKWLYRQGEELRVFASAVLDQLAQDDPEFYALLIDAYGPRKMAQ